MKIKETLSKIKQIDFKKIGGQAGAILKKTAKAARDYGVFLILLCLYFVRGLFARLTRIKWLNKVTGRLKMTNWVSGLEALSARIDLVKGKDVPRMYLIELAVKNLRAKKSRSLITILGVGVGVGAIVFLVSLGYGLEKMVITRVAKLDELRMADVGLGEATNLAINDQVIEKIKAMDGVEEVIPVVSMVSKMKYNNSVLDIMSFGVDEEYIKASGIKLLKGQNFQNKDRDFSFINFKGEVAGVSQEKVRARFGEKVEWGITRFNIFEGEKKAVWQDCDADSELLGYAIRSEGGYIGEEVWGEHYYYGFISDQVGYNPATNREYSKWMRAKVPLWLVEESRAFPMLSPGGHQEWAVGCMTEDELQINTEFKEQFTFRHLDEYLSSDQVSDQTGQVLGVTEIATSSSISSSPEATNSALFEYVVATDSAGIEWVELKRVGGDEQQLKQVSFFGVPAKEAYISSGMLKLLGLDLDKALSSAIGISYIIPDNLLPGADGRLQSEEAEYKIVGVLDDDTSNYYFFQLADAKRLGIKNYSQLKIIVANQEKLPEVRKSIETLGLKTTSTVDTVAEIERIFRTLKLILGLLGTVALAVASLGMFNTMTVSLLERTREVGALKAMGMLSSEVKELFLAESMIMGVGGGFFGILLGFLGGKILSVILSSISVLKGQAVINVSYVPWFFIGFIILVSFLVGLITGWYPSKRAREISALNALRYE